VSYLLDTNVLSELRRKSPNSGVVEWFAKRPATTLYLSVLTLGELRKGVDGLTDTARRASLLDWLETDLPAYFTGRILPIDVHVADRWGRILAVPGRTLPAIDSLIGATAAHYGLSLVTRNIKDFSGFGLDVINPWTDQAA